MSIQILYEELYAKKEPVQKPQTKNLIRCNLSHYKKKKVFVFHSLCAEAVNSTLFTPDNEVENNPNVFFFQEKTHLFSLVFAW